MTRNELVEASEAANKTRKAAHKAYKQNKTPEGLQAWYDATDRYRVAQHAAAASAPRYKAPKRAGRDNQAGRRQWAIMNAEQQERKLASANRRKWSK